MKKFLLYLFVISSCNVFKITKNNDLFAEQKRTITISSGYLEMNYTNKQIANFGLEFLGLLDYVDLKLEENISEKPYKLFYNLLLFWVTTNFTVAYHELGHALRANAIRLDYEFLDGLKGKKIGKGSSNFFEFLLVKMLSVNLGGATRFKMKDDAKFNYKIYVDSGGLNNQVYFSERIAYNSYLKNRNTMSEYYYNISSYTMLYFFELAGLFGFTGGVTDQEKLELVYKSNNLNISEKDMIIMLTFSTLFSQSTYSSIYNVFVLDRNYIEPFQYNGFIFPDIFPYITTKGLSYRVNSAYRYDDDLIFRFGVEFITHGKSAQELMFGVNTKFIFNTRFDFMTVLGKNGANFESTFVIPVAKRLNFNLDFDFYSINSLYGERHASKVVKILEGDSSNILNPLKYSYYYGMSVSYLF